MKKILYLCYFLFAIFFLIASWILYLGIDEGISVDHCRQQLKYMNNNFEILKKITVFQSKNREDIFFNKLEIEFKDYLLGKEGDFYCIDNVCFKIIDGSIQEIALYSDIPLDF